MPTKVTREVAPQMIREVEEGRGKPTDKRGGWNAIPKKGESQRAKD